MPGERRAGGRVACGCLLAAALLAATPVAGLSAADGTAKATPYDLTVLVYLPDAGPARAALSYPRVVDGGAIEQGLRELAGRTGAEISDVRVRDGRQGRGMAEVGTAAEFTAEGLVERGRGALPVGPIVRCLPEWQHMRLVFMVGQGSGWSGPGTTSADGFSVRLLGSMQPYEYDVERKNGSMTAPEVPPRARNRPRMVLPAALVGLAAGLAIGLMAMGERRRSSPAGKG